MANMVWSIAIISAGIVSPVIQQIGSFQDEAACLRSLADLKSQLPVPEYPTVPP